MFSPAIQFRPSFTRGVQTENAGVRSGMPQLTGIDPLIKPRGPIPL